MSRKKKDERTVNLRFLGGPAAGSRRWSKDHIDLCFRLDMGRSLYIRTGEFTYEYLRSDYLRDLD